MKYRCHGFGMFWPIAIWFFIFEDGRNIDIRWIWDEYSRDLLGIYWSGRRLAKVYARYICSDGFGRV